MNYKVIILFHFSTILFCISCNKHSNKIEPVLQHSEEILEQAPDSALIALGTINNPQRLKKEQYYKYYLLQIQAKYKSYKDISRDTLIFDIRDFYNDINDIENTSLATYYSGRVYEEQGKFEDAMTQFLYSQQSLKGSKNHNLNGLCNEAIGKMYFKQYLFTKAIKYYKSSEKYYSIAGNYKNQSIANKFIANCFLLANKKDSALFYYDEALTLADLHKIQQQQSEIRQGIGLVFREKNDLEQAISYFNDALHFASDSLNKAKLTANLARIHELKGDSKSALSQLQLALGFIPEGRNYSLMANIYKTWSIIEENNKNYKEALDKYRLYNKYLAQIISENKNSALLEIEAKYESQLIENQNKQLLVQRQRILILSLFLILILVSIILITMLNASKRERRLKEAEQKILKMQEMTVSYNEKENSFRNVLIRHFDILKKTALLDKYLNEDERRRGERLIKKFNEVVYEQQQIDWDLLFKTLNNASNGCFERLKKKYTYLDDSEFRICCLIYSDFNNTEIALILNYRINTVEVKKTAIRKKFGIENRGNIRDFLNKCL